MKGTSTLGRETKMAFGSGALFHETRGQPGTESWWAVEKARTATCLPSLLRPTDDRPFTLACAYCPSVLVSVPWTSSLPFRLPRLDGAFLPFLAALYSHSLSSPTGMSILRRLCPDSFTPSAWSPLQQCPPKGVSPSWPQTEPSSELKMLPRPACESACSLYSLIDACQGSASEWQPHAGLFAEHNSSVKGNQTKSISLSKAWPDGLCLECQSYIPPYFLAWKSFLLGFQ